MGYVDENLLPGEQIEYRAHLHRILFLPALVLAAAAVVIIILGFASEEARPVAWGGLALMVVAGIVALVAWVKYTSSEFAVTNRRVLIKVGVIRRHTAELLLGKVEGIGVNQTLMGRLLDYGTITVTGTGGTQETFNSIADPLELRRRIQHHSAPLGSTPLSSGAGPAAVASAGGPFCTACGAGNPAGASFCSRCGQKLLTG